MCLFLSLWMNVITFPQLVASLLSLSISLFKLRVFIDKFDYVFVLFKINNNNDEMKVKHVINGMWMQMCICIDRLVRCQFEALNAVARDASTTSLIFLAHGLLPFQFPSNSYTSKYSYQNYAILI